jgi:uncharacterized SAM-binding protein YcdF (DUF218 family)
MRNIKLFIFILITAILFWSVGLYSFIKEMNKLKTTDTQKAEAIIVLTGGRNRINNALKIYKNNNEKQKLLISGVNSKVNIKRILNFYNLNIKNIDNISIGHDAKDTVGNAKESAKWIRKNNIKSVLLVTSDYHIARAKLELKIEDKNVNIIEYPIHSPFVKKPYWKNIGSFCLISIEYTKYLITKIKYKLVRN